MIHRFESFNNAIVILMTLLYLYHLVYTLLGLWRKNRIPVYRAEKLHKYAVMIYDGFFVFDADNIVDPGSIVRQRI